MEQHSLEVYFHSWLWWLFMYLFFCLRVWVHWSWTRGVWVQGSDRLNSVCQPPCSRDSFFSSTHLHHETVDCSKINTTSAISRIMYCNTPTKIEPFLHLLIVCNSSTDVKMKYKYTVVVWVCGPGLSTELVSQLRHTLIGSYICLCDTGLLGKLLRFLLVVSCYPSTLTVKNCRICQNLRCFACYHSYKRPSIQQQQHGDIRWAGLGLFWRSDLTWVTPDDTRWRWLFFH